MDRAAIIEQLEKQPDPWDIIIIGGGATGLGAAVDASARGYRTLLLEQSDFAKGTSSRSTKLVHGGVRYLRQGNVSLVRKSLSERGLLLLNAPHLAHDQSFIIPTYARGSGLFYGVGLKFYDLMAGKLSLGRSQLLSREQTLSRLPTLEPRGLRGGVVYHDGQFDDSRLAVNLAQTAADLGGAPLNYMRVTGLLKTAGRVRGIRACDAETGREYELHSRVVINATGVFVDEILRLDNPAAEPLVAASQGVHLVLDASYLPGDFALMVPRTDDGRVLFAVPWLGKVIVGTTDTPVDRVTLEPLAMEEEIDFILSHAARYLVHKPRRSDVLSVFAGLRPLVKPSRRQKTASVSRDHYLFVSPAGLVTITGGKWTTYRKMGEDAVNRAATVGGLGKRASTTKHLRIHGWQPAGAGTDANPAGPLQPYGSDASAIRALISSQPALGAPLHPRLPYLKAQVVWAARREMARTVEDVLARRTRALFLDARASIEAAPAVAELLAAELRHDDTWRRDQVNDFTLLARGYLLKP